VQRSCAAAPVACTRSDFKVVALDEQPVEESEFIEKDTAVGSDGNATYRLRLPAERPVTFKDTEWPEILDMYATIGGEMYLLCRPVSNSFTGVDACALPSLLFQVRCLESCKAFGGRAASC
jgi:hypothetical protein